MRATHQLLLLLCILISPAIYAVDELEHATLDVGLKEWRVGVALFDASDHDSELLSLAMPRLIRDELIGIQKHRITDTERNILAETARREKVLSSYRELANLHAERDAHFFDVNANKTQKKLIESKISDVLVRLDYWRHFSDDSVTVPEEVPVVFPLTPGGGKLWELSEFSPESLRVEEDLNVLIAGTIISMGEYFGVKISSFGLEGEMILWEGAMLENEFEQVSLEAVALARELILGRAWSSLSIVTEPPNATITVNSLARGVGFWSDATLQPGLVELEITAYGYRPQFLRERLASNEVKSLTVELEKTDQAQVIIRSIPPGASVRLGATWLGLTPLAIDRPEQVMPITIEKNAYETRVVPLYPETERLSIPLEHALVDPIEKLTISKKKLYNSIAMFSFSLAPTVILLGISRNYAGMNARSTSADDLASSLRAYQLSNGFMWGSIAVNAGLLTHVLLRLSKYLKAAEDLTD